MGTDATKKLMRTRSTQNFKPSLILSNRNREELQSQIDALQDAVKRSRDSEKAGRSIPALSGIFIVIGMNTVLLLMLLSKS